MRRQGVTLMEVLVAIIICGIGLLALLTLFPLGALEMAQSIKDDRCGHIKHNAAAIANLFNVRSDAVIQNAMLNPGGGLLPLIQGNPAFDDGLSYPVFIDPIGWHANNNAGNANWRDWVGGLPGQAPRRVCIAELDPNVGRTTDPNFNLANPAYVKRQLYRWCTFLDEINFRNDDPTIQLGMAGNGTVVERTPRYSYAFMLQMPKVRNPAQSILNVVIYSGRPLDEPATGESLYNVPSVSPGSSFIPVTWDPATQPTPEIRMGTWLLDAKMSPGPRGRFYRVVSVTQTGPGSMDVELLNPPTTAGATIVMVMENVIEVYERGDF